MRFGAPKPLVIWVKDLFPQRCRATGTRKMCRPRQHARDPLRVIARRSPAVYPRHKKRRLLRGSGEAEAAAR
eukprot:scaffold65262_cov30-Phaeocystis_antarctica.AAC.1